MKVICVGQESFASAEGREPRQAILSFCRHTGNRQNDVCAAALCRPLGAQLLGSRDTRPEPIPFAWNRQNAGRDCPTAVLSFCRFSVCLQNDVPCRFRRSDLCRPKSTNLPRCFTAPPLMSGSTFAFFRGEPKEGRLRRGETLQPNIN